MQDDGVSTNRREKEIVGVTGMGVQGKAFIMTYKVNMAHKVAVYTVTGVSSTVATARAVWRGYSGREGRGSVTLGGGSGHAKVADGLARQAIEIIIRASVWATIKDIKRKNYVDIEGLTKVKAIIREAAMAVLKVAYVVKQTVSALTRRDYVVMVLVAVMILGAVGPIEVIQTYEKEKGIIVIVEVTVTLVW